MSRNNRNNKNRSNQTSGRNQTDGRIPKTIKLFAKYTLKKYKKKYKKEYGWSKKETKKAYFNALMDALPDVINWCLREGYKTDAETQEIVQSIYAKLTDPWFVKSLHKQVTKGEQCKNLKLLPMVIRSVLQETEKINRERLAKDPKASIYEMDDLVELSADIMGKSLKRMIKAGVDEQVAFNILSIIPTEEALRYSPNYRIFQFFDCLYEASKGKAIPFKQIMQSSPIPEEKYPLFIVFAMLERKEKYGNLTENQKKFYLDVTNWVFDTLNSMNREEIRDIITAYVNGRKQDDARGKDSNRRYALSTLGENDYEKIVKVIKNMLINDPSIEKYL